MEEVFKRESYLKDAFSFVMVSGLLVISYYSLPYYFPRYILDSSALMFLMFAIHIGIWLLIVMHFLSAYKTTLTLSNDGIAVKYRKDGWSYSWSEIDEWKSTIDSEGTREIKLTADGNHQTLPSEIIDNKSYRLQIKSILREHCGEPTRVDDWTVSDDTDGWHETT